MFRKRYIKIASLLIVSTAVLLLVVGSVVYFVLKSQLTRDADILIRGEVQEVQEIVQDGPQNQGTISSILFSDDRGQNIFFAVYEGKNVTTASPAQPVAPAELLGAVHVNGYATIQENGHPYRVLRGTYTQRNHTYMYLIYTSIHQTFETLEHVRNLMLITGCIGLLISFWTNVRLADWALRPARATWEAMQHSMVELSHEILTPLATAGAILANREVPSDTRAELERELGHASEMVRDILYLARLQAQDGDAPSEPVAVSDLTEEIIERFIPLLSRKHIHLSGFAVPGLYVQTTPEKWGRMVSTLLKNVVDHAEPNTKATWRVLVEGGRFVCFVLENTATRDVAERDVAAIPSQSRGFGLQIVARIVEEMHGEWHLERADRRVNCRVRVPRLARER